MKHLHTFENFLNEASASSYKHVVQTALKQLGYDVKQSDLKVGVKKERLYDIITLNGESLCSSSDFAQMTTWIQNAVKEDPSKYGLDPKVLENEVSEAATQGGGLSYWTDYEKGHMSTPAWMSKEESSMPAVLKLIDKCIDNWNKEAEDGPITKASEQHIGDLAIRYWKEFRRINGNIITAMIMQEAV